MILNVYKEPGMTSRDVVNQVSKHFKTKKVGHTGTLDPIAEGVLLICIGKDTKLVEVLTSKEKEYVATVQLGFKTDTLDTTGKVIEEKEYSFTKEELINVLNSMLGKSIQEVPIYSAVKINGKKLYEYARNGEEVTLPKREIEVSSISLLDLKKDSFTFKCTVSKGTYIRALIDTICTKLNTVGSMSKLVRTKQGRILIEDSNTLEQIENNTYKEISIEEVCSVYPMIHLTEEQYKKVINGVKMVFDLIDPIIYLKYNDIPVALYQKDNDIYRMYKKF